MDSDRSLSLQFFVHLHVCKACGSHATASCCPHYSVANRSKRYVIENLVCVENPICAERAEDGFRN
jgi:TPP-dependent indolepyruvate ferredoxin oxidoreductase alpha subunit